MGLFVAFFAPWVFFAPWACFCFKCPPSDLKKERVLGWGGAFLAFGAPSRQIPTLAGGGSSGFQLIIAVLGRISFGVNSKSS